MAKTKAEKMKNKHGAIFSSSGYKGVMRMGSKYGWRYESASGSFSKGGFDSADEAAYHYDEFLINHLGADNAITNQMLGLLKEKTVLAIREKISRAERPKTVMTKSLRSKTGFKGVVANRNKNSNRYSANCYHNGKVVYIGSYSTPQEAARAYDSFALSHVGPHAETNVKLGLLPPVSDPVFEPDPIKRQQNQITKSQSAAPIIPPDIPDDEDDDSQAAFLSARPDCAAWSSPEEERARQIEAARQMKEEEETDADAPEPETPESEPSQTGTPDIPPAGDQRAESANVPEEQSVTIVPAPPLPTPSISGELILAAGSSPADLRKQAELLLNAAAKAEQEQIKHQILNIVDGLSHAAVEMQQELSNLIDRAAEIEHAISQLRGMLKSSSNS